MLDDYSLKAILGGFLILVPFFVEVSWYLGLWGDRVLGAIPTIGFSDPILSYLSAFRFYLNSEPMLKEGYDKTRPGLFKIASFRRWTVFASGSDLIEDIKRAPDNVLARKELFEEILQLKYTIGLLNPKDMYSTEQIRTKFTRDLPSTFKSVCEELIMAMDELIPASDHEWVKVPFIETARHVMCFASNRAFVGAPLCRDRDYQKLNLDFVFHVSMSAAIVSWFPEPLKPIVSRTLTNLPSKIQQEIDFIRPLVEERFAKMEEYGKDWDDKPNDLLMGFMNAAKGVERSVEGFARRLLVVNFAGIHSTALTATHVLYRLLANPEYLEPLREEVDAVIEEEGWTKAGMDKLYKIDSFVRETQRLDGFAILPTSRLVLRPFTFSNGVTIPAGAIVSIPASSIHKEERVYSNPDEFDGFRFEKLRKNDQDTTTRYQSVATSNDYFPFGIGRYTCPGRFLATNEIKALFAYIIKTYDVKFEEGKGVPRGSGFAQVRIPASANVMFRIRQK